MKSLRILAMLLVSGCVHNVDVRQLVVPVNESADILFHDAAVFTATSRELLQHQDVLVRGKTIVSISPTAPAPAGVKVIEAAGKTLMPGLIDAHGHPTGTGSPFYYLELPKPAHNLEAHLYSGVTTVFVPGGDPEELRALNQKIASTELAGPQLFYAGKIIGHAGGYPVSMMDVLLPPILAGIGEEAFVAQVRNPEEAKRAAEKNLAGGASFLKVAVTQLPDANAPRLTFEEIQAVTQVAHAAKKLVVAHVDSADDAMLAVRAGVDALWHNVQLDALTPEHLAAIKTLKAVTPTVRTFDVFEQFYDANFKSGRLVRESESVGALHAMNTAEEHKKDMPPSLMVWLKGLRAHHDDRIGNVKKLADAGLPLLVGTDANGSDGSFPGQMAEEMAALHAAGIENADILLGATSKAATFLFGESAEFGTIAAGKRADLLLLDGDPLKDIDVMSNISVVMAAGRVMKRNTP